MIDQKFWEEARNAWIVVPPPSIKDVTAGTGGTIDASLLMDPLEYIRSKGGSLYEENKNANLMETRVNREPEIGHEAESISEKKLLDRAKLHELMDRQDMEGYIDACSLLMECELPEAVKRIYQDMIEQMMVLADSIEKFKDIYQTDMDQFYEYYIPEALNITTTYIDYRELGIGEDTILGTENEVLQALEKLRLALVDKKNEIYQFATIELKAKAKALESLMSQDGYVDPSYKI